MSESQYTPGRFVWRELTTTDVEASRRFYGELLNWKIEKTAMPGMDYFVVHAGDRQVGGMMQMNVPNVPPHWKSYVSVTDVNASVAAAKANGGTVVHGPDDVPGVGTMAMISDPQGAVFSVFKDAKGDAAPATPKLGEFCWEQLNTSDIPAAKAFYTAVAGWTATSFNGMDTFNAGEGPNSGVASFMAPPPGVPSHWLTFAVVDNLGAANDRAARLGGAVMMANIDVPTIGAFSVIRDNVGAHVCLFQPAPR